MVEPTIFRNISDPAKVVGSFNPTNNEYSLYVPSNSGIYTNIWVYNFLTKAWTYDEVENINTISDIQYGFAQGSIDDLVGTIDDLAGTINELGVSEVIARSVRVYGTSAGHILLEDAEVDKDNTAAFETEIHSRQFSVPETDISIAEIRLEYIATKSGTFDIYYSKDGGNNWKFGKTFTLRLGRPTIAKFIRNIKARRFMWRIVSTSSDFQLLTHELYAYQSGASDK